VLNVEKERRFEHSTFNIQHSTFASPMTLLQKLANRRDPGSLSSWFRRRRSHHLAAMIANLPPPVRILDVGGDPAFWETIVLPADVEIVITNIDPLDLRPFADASFDLVVSNSVIEHVGTAEDQAAMARAVRRVGRGYYVQTPNRWFPVDPHYLVPLVHLLPRGGRVALLQRFNLGWLARARERAEAERQVDTIRLLTAGELQSLFPDGRLWRERIAGLTKSLIVTRSTPS
jgi:hypothetical protein